MFKKLLFISIQLLFIRIIPGQDVVFSTPNCAPVYVNPAFTGSTGDLRAFNIYRNQHGLLSGDLNSDFLFADYLIGGHGIGISIFTDQSGLAKLSKTEIGLNYAYFINLNDNWSISLGNQFLLGSSSINMESSTFGDQLNSDFTVSEISAEEQNASSRLFVDENIGSAIFSKSIWFGCSIAHLLSPKLYSFNSDFKIRRKIQLQAGYVIKIIDVRNPNAAYNDLNKFIISSEYVLQGNISRLNIVSKVYYNSIIGFIGISNFNPLDIKLRGLSAGIGYEYEGFQLCYGYELFNGNIKGVGGGHEITFGFTRNRYNKERNQSFMNKKSLKTFCPMQ